MKKSLSPWMIAGAIALVVLALGIVATKTVAAPADGPPESVTKMTRADMERQRAAGPPPGERPLPQFQGPGAGQGRPTASGG